MAASSSDTQPVLETVKYLREKGPGALQSDFKLTSKKHGKHPNLCLFKYHQTQSDFDVRMQIPFSLLLEALSNLFITLGAYRSRM